MDSHKKLSWIAIIIISCAFLALMMIVANTQRNSSVENAREKASITAQLIKDGLTNMMMNGVISNREHYLKKISNTDNIESLWIIRAPSVIEQFGKGLATESAKDSIDIKVINEGNPYQEVIETFSSVKLRFTVPYTAHKNSDPNCLACHQTKEGSTLGAVSMVFDITESRNEGLISILYMLGISIIIIGLVLWALNYSLKPFMLIFEQINTVMSHAKDGDYSKRVIATNANSDGKKVATWINSFLDNLENTLHTIQGNLQDFFIVSVKHESDPLKEAKYAIDEMAHIYSLKRTIEFDESKKTLYARLAVVMEDRFKLSNFQIIEFNSTTGETATVYSCQENTNTLPSDVRSFRTRQIVFSDQFRNICPKCSEISEHYACIPYIIDENMDFMLHFIVEDKKELERIKHLVPIITNYVDAVRPEIVSKNLNDVLKKSSITDQLTGLYNRAYLDEFIDKATAQALRQKVCFGILMIDIDFFKIVNDTYGHDVGDRAIRALSNTILNSIRESDIAFRYGGEEFLIILYGCDPDKVKNKAELIRTNFEKAVIETGNGKTFNKTISIGASVFPNDSTSVWSCIKFSDIALYAAKDTGRNKVVTFNDSLLGEGDLKQTYKPDEIE